MLDNLLMYSNKKCSNSTTQFPQSEEMRNSCEPKKKEEQNATL